MMLGGDATDHSNTAKYKSAILQKLGKKVRGIHILNGNEIHVILSTKEEIPESCYYVHKDLKTKLATVICSDERLAGRGFMLRYVFAKENGEDVFIILTARIKENDDSAGGRHLTFPSIALHIPSAALYEREIKDMFGIWPDGNPDTRPLVLHEQWPEDVHPLRKDFDINSKIPRIYNREYPFTKVEGEGVCEIPVGPVHAGIIEPGHFRFSVLGENIINLETRLFYTHKGTEKLAESMNLDQVLLLSERISGDEAVANSMAYCQALERIARANVPKRALQIRTICAEMERIYNHLGTLAGMSTDVGFAYGASRLNILKERMMQLNEYVSGSRLLFGVNRIGGVGIDLMDDKLKHVVNTTNLLSEDFQRVISMLKDKSSVMDRMRNTGIITRRVAADLGLVGVAARCAGIDADTRRDHPYAEYDSLRLDMRHDTPQHLMEYEIEMQKMKGDALSRFEVRVEDVVNSISIVNEVITNLHSDNVLVVADVVDRLEPYSHALGYAESHRGQTIHWVMIGEDCNSLSRYKIRTASFVNWPAIEQAVLNDIVPDFPLVNKSLDLSYSGNDL
ncbi:NADH-quinone oxidoreductase subunit C [Candidatus Nitrososphaera evergladensis]|nr:NADH-quinone oxidoreductase subunit C [Candidatus Nitrososphaera evergladensis]